MDMTALCIFRGTSAPVDGVGTFSPANTLSRAEFITAALRAVYPEDAAGVAVDADLWWRGYYALALDMQLIAAEELDAGDLGQPMSREEMAMVLVRCADRMDEELNRRIETSQIPDFDTIGTYYRDYVRDCFSFGLLCGVDDLGTFAPARTLTREEVATVLGRLINEDMRIDIKFEDAPPTDTEDVLTPITPPVVPDQPDVPDRLPWEETGRDPSDYTWAEFEALPDEHKEAFYESFATDDDFMAWLNRTQENVNT